MNPRRHPARTQLWILACAAAIGLALYLAIPSSLAYVLIGLFVLLHFVMHAGHDHGAHNHGRHDHASTDAPAPAAAHTSDDRHDRHLP